jgi:hypothetical protein
MQDSTTVDLEEIFKMLEMLAIWVATISLNENKLI